MGAITCRDYMKQSPAGKGLEFFKNMIVTLWCIIICKTTIATDEVDLIITIYLIVIIHNNSLLVEKIAAVFRSEEGVMGYAE